MLSPVASPDWSPLSLRLYEQVPRLFVLFSLVSTYGMLIWQLLMLPLALINRWTRYFVVVWGLLFFAFSTFILHLKTLGVYEFVLWITIFWNGALRPFGPPRTAGVWLTRRGEEPVRSRWRFRADCPPH